MFTPIPYPSLAGKRVLCREDLNVPTAYQEGVHTLYSSAKIDAIVSNIKQLIEAGAKVAIMSHFGRPTEGAPDKKNSLAFLAPYLEEALTGTGCVC